LHWSGSAPEGLLSHWTSVTAPAPSVSKPFGDIAIDGNVLAQLKQPIAPQPSAQVASLEAAPRISASPFPLPSLEPFSPAPGPTMAPLGSLPAPPEREAPEVGTLENFPLPPVRPTDLATQPVAPSRRWARPEVAVARPAAPADNRNVLEKLFGWGRQGAPAQGAPAIASVAPARTASQSVVAEQTEREAAGLGRGPLFSFPSPFGRSAPVSGYDRNTAVYDISARVVYLPDGTRLEAHSGLGPALDDPRYVSARARGPTPPHLYTLTLREGSFHGVQALRLNPVGEGGIYGRAGLLAHPFMLGPNGDSNGCVSFKDYNAFLRAYENGQINKLAVVAKL
jgi:hypothetical protein